MNCDKIREALDEWSAGALAHEEAETVRRHLDECGGCREFWSDWGLIKSALREPVPLSEHSEQRIWKNLDRRINRSFPRRLREGWDDFRSWARDLDRTFVWSRVAALPATALALLVLSGMFPRADIERWNYTVLAAGSRSGSPIAEQAVTVQVSQPRGRLDGLLDTAWKIPYEDSLWLTADIQPDGKAAIGDVIEYPKNLDLLEAVDQTLRNSKFELAENLVNPVVIYSFQKVDVYEARVF